MNPLILLLLASSLELRGEAGAFASGYRYEGGGLGEGFSAFSFSSRWVGATLHLEGGATGMVPLERQGARAGAAFSLRAGLHFRRVEFSLGALARLDDAQAPLAVLPSAAITVRPASFALTLGVLDREVGPLARLGIEYGWVTAAWAFPLGGELGLRVPLGRTLSASIRVWGFEAFNAFNAGAVGGLVLSP